MATTEAKAEAKVEPKEVDENSEPPLKYKTWDLKVSVDCEGCKRKVTKILKNISGVYKTEVDMKLQKVTVTGNVEVETLIKKLTKTGKHAELWPDQKHNNNNNSKDKKKNKGKEKEKQHSEFEGSEESSHAGGGGGGGEIEKETVKAEVVQVQESGNKGKNEGGGNKKVDGGNMVKASEVGGGGAQAKAAPGGAQAKASGGGQVKESKQAANLPSQSTVAEKKSGGCRSDCEVEKSGGGGASGSGSKNKKKKEQRGNANVDEDEDDEQEQGGDAPPSTETETPPNHGNVPRGSYVSNGPRGPPYVPRGPSFVQVPAYHSPPPHHQVYDYQYPTQYYRPHVQAVNYNTAYTTSNYGASHYAAPPPYSQSYTYVPPSVETEVEAPHSYRFDADQPSQHYYSHPPSYSSQPSDSFELFSDENPNGCHIM